MRALTFAILLSILSFQTESEAAGFICSSRMGLRAKIFNHVRPEHGTKNPAILVVSNDEVGSLLVRYTKEIQKLNFSKFTRYTVAGSEQLGAEQVVLEVDFNDYLHVLEAGETVEGRLSYVTDGRAFFSTPLICKRYLKHP